MTTLYQPIDKLMADTFGPRTHEPSMGVIEAEAELDAAKVVTTAKPRTLRDLLSTATTDADKLNKSLVTRKDEPFTADIDAVLTFEATIRLADWPTCSTDDLCDAWDDAVADAVKAELLNETDATSIEWLDATTDSYPTIGIHRGQIVVSVDVKVEGRVRVG